MSGPTVLLAEDEDVILESLKLLLEAKGYRVLTASNGEVAIDTALREKPAVLVLDLGIPKISGVEVCRRLKSAPMRP